MFIKQLQMVSMIVVVTMAHRPVVLPIGQTVITRAKMLYANITVPQLNESSVIAFLGPAAECRALIPRTDPRTIAFAPGSIHDIILRSSLVGGNHLNSQCDKSVYTFDSGYGVRYQLGIGSKSMLVRHSGSVDCIWKNGDSGTKQPTLLVLNSTQTWFNSIACRPNSTITVPTSDVAFGIQVSTHGQGESLVNYDEKYTFSHISSSWEYIAEIPREIYAQIYGILRDSGVAVANPIRLELAEKFGNCRSIISKLPIIRFTFPSHGAISLHPEHYIRMDGDDDQCSLLVVIRQGYSSVPEPLRFNPLSLKGINTRFTNDTTAFCLTAIN